jgi:hypothetical protein
MSFSCPPRPWHIHLPIGQQIDLLARDNRKHGST